MENIENFILMALTMSIKTTDINDDKVANNVIIIQTDYRNMDDDNTDNKNSRQL